MRKPERFKQYADITARALNSHAQAIEELQALLNVTPTKRRATSPLQTKPNLWVSAPTQGGTTEEPTWEVTVTPGYLEYMLKIKDGDTANGPLYYQTPLIGGVSIETVPAPKITVEAEGYIYMCFTTNDRGVPNNDVTIQFFAEKQISVHFIPESVETNSPKRDGDFYWLIAEIEAVPDSDPQRPQIKRRLPGDKFLPNQITRLKNIGGEQETYKQFKEDESLHEFRTLKTVGSTGIAVIDPDSGSEGGTDTIDFRKIDAASASPLTVSLEGQVIQIEGNGYAGPATGLVKNLTTQDGIVTVYEVAPDGWWGVITYMDGGGDSRLRETFEDGRLTLVEVQGSGGGGTWQTLAGTQASPGATTVIVL